MGVGSKTKTDQIFDEVYTKLVIDGLVYIIEQGAILIATTIKKKREKQGNTSGPIEVTDSEIKCIEVPVGNGVNMTLCNEMGISACAGEVGDEAPSVFLNSGSFGSENASSVFELWKTTGEKQGSVQINTGHCWLVSNTKFGGSTADRVLCVCPKESNCGSVFKRFIGVVETLPETGPTYCSPKEDDTKSTDGLMHVEPLRFGVDTASSTWCNPTLGLWATKMGLMTSLAKDEDVSLINRSKVKSANWLISAMHYPNGPAATIGYYPPLRLCGTKLDVSYCVGGEKTTYTLAKKTTCSALREATSYSAAWESAPREATSYSAAWESAPMEATSYSAAWKSAPREATSYSAAWESAPREATSYSTAWESTPREATSYSDLIGEASIGESVQSRLFHLLNQFD